MFNQASLHRRSYERFRVDASAALIINESIQVPSILKDLSSRGGGIISNTPCQVDKKVAVTIMAPFFFKQAIRKEAKVVWCKRIADNLWQSGLDFGLDNLIHFE